MDEIDKIRWIKASDAPIIKTLETREEEAATFLKNQGYDLMKSADRLVPDYLSFRNTYWGQSQPVNYKLLWKMFLEDPIVYGCVNLLVEGIVGDGFKLRGGKKLHRKVLTDLLIKNEFTMVLRDLTYQMLIFGDGYLELEREKNSSKSIKDDKDLEKAYSSAYEKPARIAFTPKEDEKFLDGTFKNKYICDDIACPHCKNVYGPAPIGIPGGNEHTIEKAFMSDEAPAGLVREFYVADASTIRIDYNEHGETIKYIQRVLHRRVDFYPTEMIHFSLNNVGGRVYGHSPLQSVIETLQAKQAAERFNSDYFRRGAIPRMAWFIPNLNEVQVKRFKADLATLQPQQDVVITCNDPGMKAEQIMPTNADIQFRELLGYYKKNIIAAIGAPPVFLGEMEGANRSNAQIQLESFDRKIRTMKNSIADKINKQLFTKENFGFEDVIFEFNEDNNREELRDAQTASLLTSMTNIVDPLTGQRLVLLDEVRAKLKLPPLDEAYAEHEVLPMNPEQQQQMLMPNSGQDKKMPFAQRPDKYTDPNTNVDRAEHAEQQNTSSQMDSKSVSPASFSSKPSSGDRRIRDSAEWAKERREHPTMADEEIDQIVSDHANKEVLSHGKLMDPEEARLRMLRGKLFGQNLAEYPPGSTRTSNENPDISPHDSTVRDREVRNPYGATQFHVEKPQHRLAAEQSERLREILQVALNPVTNAQELNTDRRFPKDSTEVPQKGLPLTHNVPPEAEAERQRNQPERDEVDAMGRTVWAANDSDNQKDKDGVEADAEARAKIRASKNFDIEEAKLKMGKAIFYQDSTQLDEVNEDGSVVDQGSEAAD